MMPDLAIVIPLTAAFYAAGCLVLITKSLVARFRARKFRPGVSYDEDPLKLTQLLLEDKPIVWCPAPGPKGHWVDLGYDFDGNLVGVQVWADVRTRADLEALRLMAPAS